MKIRKILNNNSAVVLDDDNQEVVVIGKAIAFKKKIGDAINPAVIEKKFCLSSQSLNTKFQEVIVCLPLEEISLVTKIIDEIKMRIGKKISDSIYVSLSDHIHFALKNYEKGIHITNNLMYDIQRFYPDEYKLGLIGLDIIEKETGVRLNIDEAGFIALHFVNSEYDTSISDAAKFPTEIHKILDLIHHEFKLKVDEKSLNYERLLTHVKFLLQRVYRNEMLKDEDLLIIQTIKRQCEKEFDCCRKISSSIKEATGKELTEAEMVYMAIHIRRLLNTNKE